MFGYFYHSNNSAGVAQVTGIAPLRYSTVQYSTVQYSAAEGHVTMSIVVTAELLTMDSS